MNTLIYSEKCSHCRELLDFIDSNDELKQVTRFHDVNRSGVPRGVTRVPTLVRFDGGVLIGRDISEYFESIIVPKCEGACSNFGTTIDGSTDDDGIFTLDKYGSSLAPKMTKELEARITADVKSSFQTYQA